MPSSRIGPYELNAPSYNPVQNQGDRWLDAGCVVDDKNRSLGVHVLERPYPKMRAMEPELDGAYREDEQLYRRLDALNAENARLEQENKLFKETNVGLKELLPQMPYCAIPPAQLGLPQFWSTDDGHPVAGIPDPVPMLAPGLAEQPQKDTFDFKQTPAPADAEIANKLNELHQPYLEQRQMIIDDREADYQALQKKLQEALSEKPVIEPAPVKEPEEVLYAERSHSRLPFSKFESWHRTYATQWKLRPERAARGHKYLGEWSDAKEHGRGLYSYQDGKFVGDWEHGRPHGHGVFMYANGDTHEGSWKDGAKSGDGTYTYAQYGNEYKGQWCNDKRHGHGVYTTAEGAQYDGQWNQGAQHGDGIVDYPDGSKYAGQWSNDHEEGHGEMNCTKANEFYQGQWRGGLKHGKGLLHFEDGTCYLGWWINGKDTHEGTFGNSDGTALGSDMPRELMMPTPECQSSRNQEYSVEFPYHFSLNKSTGSYGGASPLTHRRGVPTEMR